MPLKTKREIVLGESFGMLTVVSIKALRPGLEMTIVTLKCECGEFRTWPRKSLLRSSRVPKSCGCITYKSNSETFAIHGMARTKIYKIWSSMRRRCENPNDKGFVNYGGRGIKVCDRWKKFENFYADMGDRPDGKSLDRVNNDGNYEPGNCRWAGIQQQSCNKRTCRFLTIYGKRLTVSQWAHISGVPQASVGGRVRKGWDAKKAVFTPVAYAGIGGGA